MASLNSLKIKHFLQSHLPFKGLPESVLDQLTEEISVLQVPTATYLYKQDETPVGELSIIYQGAVEKFFLRADGTKHYREEFGVGQSFGAMSILLNNERAVRAVYALEETTILQIPLELFQALIQAHPEFYAFYSQQFGERMLDYGYASHMLQKDKQLAGFQTSDLAFNQRIRHLYTTQYNACSHDATIQEAAVQMSTFRRSYIIIKDQEEIPVGIVTDQVLRNLVVAKGLDVQEPISSIMISPLYQISIEAYSYEAILKMFRLKINYLLVEDLGRIVGLVSLGKLLNAQGKSPFIFVQSIQHEEEVWGLQKKWRQVPAMVDHLIQRGMRPEIVNQIVSSVADAASANIVRRAIKKLGKPPVEFAFIALGSEGRKEQTLKTDQDNAMIYADVEESRVEETRDYFLQLGTIIADELNDTGFEYCKGGLMAKNQTWSQPLSVWKQYYTKWITQPMDQNAVIGGTFFDCRTIVGNKALLDQLRGHMFSVLDKSGTAFLARLGQAALVNRVPLRFFGGFQETTSEDRKGIEIKRAMQTITDFARIFALREHLVFTNTGVRLEKLRDKGILRPEEFQEIHQAYYFMMRLRLSHQTGQILNGDAPDNLIPVDELSKIERVTLREIFKRIDQYQKRINITFLNMLNP